MDQSGNFEWCMNIRLQELRETCKQSICVCVGGGKMCKQSVCVCAKRGISCPLESTYSLHVAQSFLRGQPVLNSSRNSPHFIEPEVHYCGHKSPPPVSILSHINPVNVPTSHFLQIHLNIILPSTLGSTKLFLSLRFSFQNLVCTPSLPHKYYVPRPSRFCRL